MGDISGNQAKSTAKKARLSQEAAQARQAKALEKRTAIEDARRNKIESDIENVKERSKRGKASGRRSLIKSSPTGLSTNLGGTNA